MASGALLPSQSSNSPLVITAPVEGYNQTPRRCAGTRMDQASWRHGIYVRGAICVGVTPSRCD
jgi:hypothetical protein